MVILDPKCSAVVAYRQNVGALLLWCHRLSKEKLVPSLYTEVSEVSEALKDSRVLLAPQEMSEWKG